jgi:gliding motility-associated-like protein
MYIIKYFGLSFLVALTFISYGQDTPSLVWAKSVGGSLGDGSGKSIATDLNGNVYTGGTFSNTFDFDPGPGTHTISSSFEQDGFIQKLDADGNYLWAINLGGQVNGIAIDGAGNVYATGWFVDDQSLGLFDITSQGHSDAFIIKLDQDGNLLWVNTIGGVEYEEGKGVAVDNSGNVYITGFFTGANVNFGSLTLSGLDDSQDIFVAKLDTDGNFLWAKNMGGDSNDEGTGIATRSGNVYVTGSFFSPTSSSIEFGPFFLSSEGDYDIFVCSLDEDGNFDWAKSMGGPSDDYGYGIAVDGDGNVYTTGSFQGTVDFNPASSAFFPLTVTGSPEDIFVSKLDVSGDFVWAKSFGGSDADSNGIGYSVATNTSGDVYVAGYFYGDVDFDPDPTSEFHVFSNPGTIFICKLTSSGAFVWADGFGGQGINEAKSISTDDTGNVYVTGSFGDVNDDPVDFAPGSCTSYLTSISDNYDIFIQKIGTAPASCTGSEITIDLQPVSQTVCVGTIVNFVINASGTTNITYQWQAEFDDGDGGFYWDDLTDGGGISGTSTNTLTINTTGNFGEGNFRCIVSGDLASDEISDEVFLDIGPNMPIVLGSTLVHCGPGAMTITAFGGVNGQYRWYTQASGGSPIAGEINSTYTTPVLTNTTTYYVAINNGTCESARNSIQISISTCTPQPGFVWAQGMGVGTMANGSNGGSNILIDADGNLIVSGGFQGIIDFDNGPGIVNLTAGNTDAFLMKMTPAGTLLWAKDIGGPGSGNDGASEMAIDGAGNIYMSFVFNGTADFDPGVGVTSLTSTPSTPANKNDLAVAKYDRDGNFIWVRQIAGVSDEYAGGLKADNAGNVYITGAFRQIASGTSFGSITLNALGTNSTDVFVAKLNASGTFLWAKNIGSPLATAANLLSDIGVDIDIDGLGNVYVSGRVHGPNITVDFDPGAGTVPQLIIAQAGFLLKLDNNGVYLNHYIVEGAAGNVVRVDASSNVYITGAFTGTVDIDPGAGTFNVTGDGANYITKLNASGNFVWGKVLSPNSGTSSVLIGGIVFDAANDLYLTGYITGTTDFDPGPLVESVGMNGFSILNSFLWKLNSNGDYNWVMNMRRISGSFASASFASVVVSATGDLFSTGSYARNVDLDPGSCTFGVTNVNGSDILISKFSPTLPNICISTHPASISACDNTTVTFTTTVTSANSVLYQWQKLNTTTSLFENINNTGGYSGATTSVLTVNTAGNFGIGNYRCKIYSDRTADAFSNSASLSLTGVLAPVAVGTSGCFNTSFILSATGGLDGQYRWYTTATGGSSISGAVNSTYATPILSLTTTYYVSLNLGGSCESTRTPVAISLHACAPIPDLVWAKSFASNSYSLDMITDAAGNVYTSGASSGGDFDPGPGTFTLSSSGQSDAYVSKLDASGNLVWAKSFGGIQTEVGQAIALDAAGNIYVTGNFQLTVDFDPGPGSFPLTSAGGHDAYVLKLDPNGNFISAWSFGSSTEDIGSEVTVDASGNIYLAGHFSGIIDFDPGVGTSPLSSSGGTEIYIVKLNSAGNFLWAKAMGGSSTDVLSKTHVDTAGNIYTTGFFYGASDFDPGTGTALLTAVGASDVFVSKLDANGNFIWAKSFGAEGLDNGVGISTDASGNVIVSGYFENTVDFDPGTATLNFTSQGDKDIFLLKLNASGNLVWAKTMGAANEDIGNDVLIDALDNIYFSGSFYDIVDIDGGSSTFNLTSTGNQEIFVSQVDAAGNFIWGIQMGGSSNEFPTGMTMDVSKNIYLTGGIYGSGDFDPGSAIVTLTPVGPPSSFVQKLGAPTPFLVITTQPSSTTACTGANATFTVAATGTTNIIYQWQKLNTTTSLYENISNTGGYSGATLPILTINTAGNFGAGDYRCKITGDLVASVLSDIAALSINSTTASPTTAGNSRCTPGPVSLTASGGTNGQYRWYDVATGGTALTGETGNTFTTPSLSSTTSYYVSIVNGCESARTIVTATISSTPTAPTATGASRCGIGTVTLTASGGSGGQYRWYAAVTGGNAFAGENNNTFTTPSLTITTSYFVAINNGFCESTRTQVTATLGGTACASNNAPVITQTTIATQIEGNVTINLTPFLFDPDNNLDLSSLRIIAPPPSGARATIDANHNLILDYKGILFSGTEKLTIAVCDLLGVCVQKEFSIEVVGEINVYNGVSPNGDLQNDLFILKNIELMSETKSNHVFIYNRWGDVLFDIADYDNKNNVFRGLTNNGSEIPSGTYYYKINFTSGLETKSGYLYIKR